MPLFMADDNAPLEEKYGQPPFDSASSGDCILKCSDGVLLKASRAVLSLASSVFRDMFEIPQGGRMSTTLEPISIAESSTTFHSLLLILYPALTTKINTYGEAFALLAVHDKYDIDIAHLRLILADFFRKPLFLNLHEAHYAIAWVAGMKDEVQRAAKQLHRTDIKNAKFKSDLYKQTGNDPQAHTALLELSLQRQMALHGFIEKLPFDLYFCTHHSPSLSEVGKLRDLVNTEMNNPTPDAVRLLASLSQFFLGGNPRPLNLFGNSTPALAPHQPAAFGFLPAQSSLAQRAKTQAPSPARSCSCSGCSTQLTPKTETEIYEIVNRVALAIEAFPQTIEWPKDKAAF